MEKDDRFDPVVIVCPYTAYGEEIMLREMKQAYTSFVDKGYNVVKTYNEESKKWLDVKKEVRPDIVFFTNPHKLTKDEYCITHYTDCLTCYAPYNFGNSHLYQMMHNQLFHNYLWRLFAETPLHEEFSVKYAQNKGNNVKVTGFPGTDVFLNSNHPTTNIWKQKNTKIKKIIWAPHHSIENNTAFLSYSSFLMYADFMVRMTNEFNGKIQVAFKPHPILRNILYEHSDWGKDKTDAYYAQWENMENGQLVVGDYVDLFLTSDAMIHDSGSFLIEYLYTSKPVLHLNRDENITDRMNAFGVLAYNQHYHAKNETQIKAFIEDVINNVDNKKTDRKIFLANELLPPNHKSASENIFEEIVKQVF
jgi:CDP-glycerol glycerophosphotransferase (TagB/SpsB family)